MADLPRRLRDDLTAALRARDKDAVRVLRTALAAIANAEAQPEVDETPTSLRSEGVIAGASEGLGSADVARKELGPDDVVAIVRAERDDRLASADDLEGRRAGEAAKALRADAALLDRYLD
ncbi:hypothetical protein GCM10009795_050690 [Nocardioides hankookensis]|uniref:GatB/YqeY domain-containing protein n=1 Tax=Nocardioides hankookensis TaxID=443157 RepID=A0ABW1LF14_9ACTN